MDGSVEETFSAGNEFNNKLHHTLTSLMSANNERKSEIDALTNDHEDLRKKFEQFQSSAERENDLRKNEIKSLEEKQEKENKARVDDIARIESKFDDENGSRKSEIEALTNKTNNDNDNRKKEIEDLTNSTTSENENRKKEIGEMNDFSKNENESRKGEIADLNNRLANELSERTQGQNELNDKLRKEADDRQNDTNELRIALRKQQDESDSKMEDFKNRMMCESEFLKKIAMKTNSVYFDAYRTKAYDGGGEEVLNYQGTYANGGGGLDVKTGIFTAPAGGTYIFVLHIATHDNKKALLSIRHNGDEIASVFDQNHKDNHKNSMAGTTVIHDVKRGDEVFVYAYTGTWLADFPLNRYTHFIGLLLKPDQEELDKLKAETDEAFTAAL